MRNLAKEEMKESVRVSVIVGIYNVEQWMSRGMKNILSQTYQDFELILVDDGSTDACPQLCDDWAQRDSRIKVVHKINGGAGSARNAGLDVARGAYVYFYDIDDLAVPSLLEYGVSEMDKRQVDLLVFGFNMIEQGRRNSNIRCSFCERQIESNVDLRDVFLDNFVLCRGGNGFLWNKMYRRSFLQFHHARFENQRIQQDEAFNLLVYQHLERVYISSAVLYDYYVYDKGNNRSRFYPDRFEIYVSVIQHFLSLQKYWKLYDERFDTYLAMRYWNGMNQCLRFNMFHPDCPWNNQQRRKELQRIMAHPLTQRALSKLPSLSVEDRLYKRAYLSGSITVIRMLYCLFRNLRLLLH